MVATTLIPSSTTATPAAQHAGGEDLCQSCERMLQLALVGGTLEVLASLAAKHVSRMSAAHVGSRFGMPCALPLASLSELIR